MRLVRRPLAEHFRVISLDHRGHDPACVLDAFRELTRYWSHDWIREIDVPTASIITRRDGLVPASRQRRLAASIPDSEVFEIDGDHSACVTQTEVFVPTLITACLSVSARTIARRASPLVLRGGD